MGFRMSITLEDSDNIYGDDHKLYGYFDFEDVKNSFSFISKFMKEQWPYTLCYDLYNDPKEIYSLICAVNGTDDVKLSADEFKEFSKLYLQDILKNKSKECYEYVNKYFSELNSIEKPKIIWWD